jgi:superfamily II DNA or RNA helicase
MNLRAWQSEALPVLLAALRRDERVLASIVTGGGKSYLLAALLADILTTLRPGWCVVITVPTKALVVQLTATLRHVLGRERVGRWYGVRKEVGTVRVCCLPSLPTLVEQLRADGVRCALWIGDEVHRAESQTVVDALAELAPRRWLGVTATPYRSDTGLTHWPTLTYRYTMARAFDEGVLVRPRILQSTHADGEADGIAAMRSILARRPEVQGPGVAAAADIAEAEWRAAELGWLAYHSKLPDAERVRRIEALRTGATPGLVHVRALSEGVDLPWLTWLALTTEEGRNRLTTVQEIGRVLRSHPGKETCWILDPYRLTDRLNLADVGALIQAADEPEDAPTPAAVAREVKAVEKIAALARLVSEGQALLAELRFAAPSTTPAAPSTLRELDAVAKGTRWLVAKDRAAVHALLERREVLDDGTARGLAVALRAAIREAGQVYARTSAWPSGKIPLQALAPLEPT